MNNVALTVRGPPSTMCAKLVSPVQLLLVLDDVDAIISSNSVEERVIIRSYAPIQSTPLSSVVVVAVVSFAPPFDSHSLSTTHDTRNSGGEIRMTIKFTIALRTDHTVVACCGRKLAGKPLSPQKKSPLYFYLLIHSFHFTNNDDDGPRDN